MQISEQDLITGLKNNDRQVFEHLFETFYTELHIFARRLIGDEHESKDIVSTSFEKLYKLRENFETLLNIRAFLYITTRNKCLDFLRAVERAKDFQKDYIKKLSASDEDIERMQIEADVLREINKAIQNLPSKCREIFELTYLKGMKANEIAEQLGITVSTVTTQRSRAIQYLRSVFDKDDLIL